MAPEEFQQSPCLNAAVTPQNYSAVFTCSAGDTDKSGADLSMKTAISGLFMENRIHSLDESV